MTLGQRVAVMRGRSHPPGRHAAVAVRAAARPLRRRVHRLAGDEPRRGDASTATRSSFGQLRVPLDPATAARVDRRGAVILGIRPETFEDAAFAPPELPTIDVEVVVLEELGSDAHVFFRVDATRVAAGRSSEEADDGDGPRHRSRLASQCARRSANDCARRRTRFASLSIPLGSTSSTPRPAHHCSCLAVRVRDEPRLGRALTHAVLVLTSTGGRLRCSA